MGRKADRQSLVVDTEGFVFVDGVKVARCFKAGKDVHLQFCDKDRRRSSERGTDKVTIAVQELARAVQDGSTPLDRKE